MQSLTFKLSLTETASVPFEAVLIGVAGLFKSDGFALIQNRKQHFSVRTPLQITAARFIQFVRLVLSQILNRSHFVRTALRLGVAKHRSFGMRQSGTVSAAHTAASERAMLNHRRQNDLQGFRRQPNTAVNRTAQSCALGSRRRFASPAARYYQR
ncbi:hypothetical protein [Chitinimonas sp. BJYL2]|uniref:hypothetical protein n=1 Tax=Chitinimonas sp. BJYL2 TaxID=2976696 RepID=UPI0022B3FEA3|nr:hypothetical protein [Chitinimonas sp. BJYL2]